jgi:hypothetical protein
LDRLNSKGLDKAQLITIEGKSKQKRIAILSHEMTAAGKKSKA